MTNWGPEIAVMNGKRPDFVRDDDEVMVRWYSEAKGDYPGHCIVGWENGSIIAIQLPADHPHYTKPALPEGVTSELVERMHQELRLWRSLVSEGGVPRYTITPGAALNSVVTSTDAILAAMKPEPVDPLETALSGCGLFIDGSDWAENARLFRSTLAKHGLIIKEQTNEQ